MGESVSCTWRKDLRLKDSKDSMFAPGRIGKGGNTGGSEGLDFVRSREIQEKRPEDLFCEWED